MKASDVMSESPVCCDQHDTIQQAARLMETQDCGVMPIVNGQSFLVGVITDRDICCRAIAHGRAPDSPVQLYMSSPAVTVGPNTGLEECAHLMQEHQIRRIPVVDQEGRCCGIVSQADLARCGDSGLLMETVRQISMPQQAGAYLG